VPQRACDMRLTTPRAQTTLQSDKWQRVTVVVDTDAGTMTTYVGGQQCAQASVVCARARKCTCSRR
jgi:hypothetical protein